MQRRRREDWFIALQKQCLFSVFRWGVGRGLIDCFLISMLRCVWRRERCWACCHCAPYLFRGCHTQQVLRSQRSKYTFRPLLQYGRRTSSAVIYVLCLGVDILLLPLSPLGCSRPNVCSSTQCLLIALSLSPPRRSDDGKKTRWRVSSVETHLYHETAPP